MYLPYVVRGYCHHDCNILLHFWNLYKNQQETGSPNIHPLSCFFPLFPHLVLSHSILPSSCYKQKPFSLSILDLLLPSDLTMEEKRHASVQDKDGCSVRRVLPGQNEQQKKRKKRSKLFFPLP